MITQRERNQKLSELKDGGMERSLGSRSGSRVSCGSDASSRSWATDGKFAEVWMKPLTGISERSPTGIPPGPSSCLPRPVWVSPGKEKEIYSSDSGGSKRDPGFSVLSKKNPKRMLEEEKHISDSNGIKPESNEN